MHRREVRGPGPEDAAERVLSFFPFASDHSPLAKSLLPRTWKETT
jgi:hypothetical protein